MELWKSRLKAAREAKNLNKTAFARLMGVSNPTITDWEKSVDDGGIKEISGVNVAKLCAVLNIDMNHLFYGQPIPPAETLPVDPLPAQKEEAGTSLAESLKLTCETAPELRMLTVYRLANEDGKGAIGSAVERVRRRLDDQGLWNQGQAGKSQ